MTVVLVRHGETDWNVKGALRGHLDVPLNKTGRNQADRLSERLYDVQFAAGYCSPLERARVTAESILRPHRGTKLSVDESWSDMNFGAWEGLTLHEIVDRYPAEYEIWLEHPERVQIPGAETLEAVRDRVQQAVNGILSTAGENRSAVVLVVSHGLVNKVLLCAMLALDISHFWRVKQDEACINIFEYTGEGSKVYLLNDVSHIRTIAQAVERARSSMTPIGRLALGDPSE